MRKPIDDVPIEELDSALLHLSQLLTGRNDCDVAWWLCANHAKWLLDHPNLDIKLIVKKADIAGTPPKGNSWNQWFSRVANAQS